eukprot:3140606-Rhodomonas_salina.1
MTQLGSCVERLSELDGGVNCASVEADGSNCAHALVSAAETAAVAAEEMPTSASMCADAKAMLKYRRMFHCSIGA